MPRSTPPERSPDEPLGCTGAILRLIDPASQTYQLLVDGIPQSQVNLCDPTDLAFDYVRFIGRVADRMAPPRHPLACTHLGAGALTLARYLSVTRPGSPQVAVDIAPGLVDAVVARLPLPLGTVLRPIVGDARSVAETAPPTTWPGADLTIVDLWAAATIAARVASLEFYRLVASRTSPGGAVAVNLLDGPGFAYSRGQAAALCRIFRWVAVVFDPRMLHSTRFGNVLLLAADHPLLPPPEAERAWPPGDPHPPHIIAGGELSAWIGTVAPTTDATATPSPTPD